MIERRVLVTGGSGYLGSATVRSLRERGDEVVVLDLKAPEMPGAIADADLVLGDCGDEAVLDGIFSRHAFKALIHFAADKSVAESVRDPDRYFRNNVGSTLALLRRARQAGIRRFVFSSSCAVYGDPGHVPVDESHPCRPTSPYGESKLMVEQMLPWLDNAYGFRAATLRYFNAAGAALDGSHGETWRGTTGLVPSILRVAAGVSSALKIYGVDYPTPDGTAVRDYIHVVDLAEAHVRALDILDLHDRSLLVNLGTGRGHSVAEVVDVARRVTGSPIPVEAVQRRPGDIAAIWADTDRAREGLGWQARHDMETIVRSAWQWYLRSHGHPAPATVGHGQLPS